MKCQLQRVSFTANSTKLDEVTVRNATTITAAVFMAVTPAFAKDTPEAPKFEACLEIANPLSRLSCYDAFAGYESPQNEETTGGGWTLVPSKDDFTGKDTSFVYLDSDREGLSMDSAPKSLVLRCDGAGGYDVYVVANGYIGARNDRVPVRYKFDDQEPTKERWSESTDGTAAFLPSGFKDFKNGLTNSKKVLFEITDYRGSSYRATFEGLDGNTDALKLIMHGCNSE